MCLFFLYHSNILVYCGKRNKQLSNMCTFSRCREQMHSANLFHLSHCVFIMLYFVSYQIKIPYVTSLEEMENKLNQMFHVYDFCYRQFEVKHSFIAYIEKQITNQAIHI